MISDESQLEGRGFFDKLSLRDAPGWLISVGVHVVIMCFLLAVKISAQSVTEASLITSTLEDVQNEMEFDASAADQVGVGADVTTLSATTASAGAASAAAAGASSGQETQSVRVDESIRGPEVRISGVGDDSLLPAMDQLGATVGGADGKAASSGGGTENVAEEGVGGAIDRLTWEITAALHEHKTTVVWLFDQSLSLKERRDMIADRFENVYRQLENLEEKDREKGSLLTMAATYGEGFKLLTDKPVEDYKTLIPKVRAIPD